MLPAAALLDDVLQQARPGGRILYLNAHFIPALNRDEVDRYQPFKPYAEENAASLPPSPVFDAAHYDGLCVIGTKHVKETQAYIARGLSALKEGGALWIAADNKENGKRLPLWLSSLGLCGESISGHKSRCVHGIKTSDLKMDMIAEWQIYDVPQRNQDGYYTQAGIFSADHIDPASRVMMENIPINSLFGNGADFGCGYGYLAHRVLQDHPGIGALCAVDADARAVACCDMNHQDYRNKCTFVWADLSVVYQAAQQFDFILMNPPFHRGRQDDAGLGVSFIENAARNLKSGGVLWMVANIHLPYEDPLRRHFKTVEPVMQDRGFKVIRAVK